MRSSYFSRYTVLVCILSLNLLVFDNLFVRSLASESSSSITQYDNDMDSGEYGELEILLPLHKQIYNIIPRAKNYLTTLPREKLLMYVGGVAMLLVGVGLGMKGRRPKATLDGAALKRLAKAKKALSAELQAWERLYYTADETAKYNNERNQMPNLSDSERLRVWGITDGKEPAPHHDPAFQKRRTELWKDLLEPYFQTVPIPWYETTAYMFNFVKNEILKAIPYKDPNLEDYKIETNDPVVFDDEALRAHAAKLEGIPEKELLHKRILFFCDHANRMAALRKAYTEERDFLYAPLKAPHGELLLLYNLSARPE